jgi:hypothetical protein
MRYICIVGYRIVQLAHHVEYVLIKAIASIPEYLCQVSRSYVELV